MNGFVAIAPLLPDPFRLLWREKVTSTNDELRILAEQGAPEGLILVAEEQTSGRGRRGAVWLSPRGENLAFSVLLRPREPKALWHRLSLVTGLAVAEALEAFRAEAEIKWPNDVRVSGRKIAGILVESGADFVIVGIGLNVNTMDFPEELAATSLRREIGAEAGRAEVLLAVISSLARHHGKIGAGFEEIRQGLSQRCALAGRRIRYLAGGRRCEGVMFGIGPAGEMMVRTENGTEPVFQADEIRECE